MSQKFWEKKNPSRKSKKLTGEQKQLARERATSHGRRYPNLVDNAWASNLIEGWDYGTVKV